MALTLRFLHVLGALTWIGGMLFIALVFVPVARGLNDPPLRARLFHAAGVRFRAVGWVALGVLLLTGLGNLWLRPYLLELPRFQAKLGFVVLALALSAVHDFFIGPRAGLPGADPRLRVWASWLGRITLILVLVVVLLGLALRG